MREFKVEIFNEKVVAANFRESARRLGDARIAWRRITNIIMENAERRFVEEGPGWARLSPRWLARKQIQGDRTEILQQKGNLRNSVTKPGAKGQINKTTPHSLTFGTKLSYAARHQYGFENVPARPYLVTTPEEREEIARILRIFFSDPLTGAPKIAKALYKPSFTNLPRR